MENIIIVRLGEIFLKGTNRPMFENKLGDNIKFALKDFNCEINKSTNRFIISNYNSKDENSIIGKLKKVFGIQSISPAVKILSEIDLICETAFMLKKSGSFKVETNRADKRFILNSMEVSKRAGEYMFSRIKDPKVDMHNPDYIIFIDIRESGFTYLYTEIINGARGIPSGCSGSGLLLLSGGIDSPVAGYMMAGRGMQLFAVHFHSFPYTSEMAKEKVLSLAKTLSEYSMGLKLFVVPFTDIQNAIHKSCPEKYMITIMRRFMMKIAQKICENNSILSIITGESLAQVASQTVESITCTNAVITNLPVFRPLIGTDKIDIINISKKIGTYETSILPYEDCCTIFLPKNPVIKPRLNSVEVFEEKLDVTALIEKAVLNAEVFDF